jgi:hypothetical protein
MGSVLENIASSLHKRVDRPWYKDTYHKADDAGELVRFKYELRSVHERFMVCILNLRVGAISLRSA